MIIIKIFKNKGQVTVETAVAWSMIVAGLVFMAYYMQRGLQGNYWGSVRATGSQFDPRDEYSESRRIHTRFDETHQVPRAQMIAADLMPLPAGEASNPFGLSSVPTGPVFRESAFQYSSQEAQWNLITEYKYNDIH